MSGTNTHPQDNSTTPCNAPCVGLQQATPALVKRQQFQQRFQSPTDNILSPCSKMLTDPVALMRQKQKPKLLATAYANAAKQSQQQQNQQRTNGENKEN